MTLLPSIISVPLTWGLCVLLAFMGLRHWYLSRVAASKCNSVGSTWISLHPYNLNAWLYCHVVAFNERNGRLLGSILVIYAAGRALRAAFVAVPIAVITAKAFTDEKVLGFFSVFRDQPEPFEKMGRCVLLVLLFVTLVWGWDKISKWSDTNAAKNIKPASAAPNRQKGAPVLPALVLALYFIGLTPALVLILTILFFMTAVWSEVVEKEGYDTETAPFMFAGIYLMCMIGLLAIMLALHLLVVPMSGFIASILLLGIIMPLACAPAGIIVTTGIDHMIAEIADAGKPSIAALAIKSVLALGIALVGLIVLFIGLWVGLAFYALLAPSGYQLNPGLMSPTLWSDSAMLWIILFLGVTTVLTPITLVIEVLAKEMTRRSKAWQSVCASDFTTQQSEEAAATLLRAEIMGVALTALAMLMPACLLIFALFSD